MSTDLLRDLVLREFEATLRFERERAKVWDWLVTEAGRRIPIVVGPEVDVSREAEPLSKRRSVARWVAVGLGGAFDAR